MDFHFRIGRGGIMDGAWRPEMPWFTWFPEHLISEMTELKDDDPGV